MLLAERHPYLADLAISFPALLYALARPRAGFDASPVIANVIAGVPLKYLAAQAGLPHWLRMLPPEAFSAPLPALPNSDMFSRRIRNHLPKPAYAANWLANVADMAEAAHDDFALWIAREIVRNPESFRRGIHRALPLWAWYSRQPGTWAHRLIDRPWQPDLGASQAGDLTWKWFERLELRFDLDCINVDSWLGTGTSDGFDFIPVVNAASVDAEADAMKHCLRTYSASIADNTSCIFSIQRDGQRIATLELGKMGSSPLIDVVQLCGEKNATVAPEVWLAARRWLAGQQLPALKLRIENRYFSQQNAVWIAMWKPYWLAKRRIPHWLPLTRKHRWQLL